MTNYYQGHKKWRKKHPDLRNEEKKRNYAKTRRNATNSNLSWTGEEIKMIFSPNRPSDREMSAILGRSVQAIQVKRAKTPRI